MSNSKTPEKKLPTHDEHVQAGAARLLKENEGNPAGIVGSPECVPGTYVTPKGNIVTRHGK